MKRRMKLALGGLSLAAGPEIRSGVLLEPFENVDVYNFLCAVLRLQPAKNDGRAILIDSLLPTGRR